MLTILLVYGMAIDYEGAILGITEYVTPDWEKLRDISVWVEAAKQIVYSLTVGFGVLVTSSSYNKFHNNCYR